MRTLMVRALVLILMLVATHRSSHAQQTFRDEELGFSLTIPQGWTKVSKAALDKFPITPPSGGSAASLAGYVRTGTELKPPCIIIERRTQAFDLKGLTWDQLSEKLSLVPYEELEKSGQFDYRGRYKGDNLSPATLVAGNQFILVQGITNGSEGKPVYLFSVGFLGRHDIVRMSAFLPVDSTDSYLKQCEDIMHSGQFDEGKGFKAEATSMKSRSRYGRRGGLGGVGIGIAVVLYLVRRWAAD